MLRRRLLGNLSLLSLLISGITAVLWVSSYRFDTSIDLASRSTRFTLRCVGGHVGVGVFQPLDLLNERLFSVTARRFAPSEESDLEWAISDEPSGSKSVTHLLGCNLTRETVTGDVQRWAVVPAWMLVVVLLIGPALHGFRFRTLRRSHEGGLCPA